MPARRDRKFVTMRLYDEEREILRTLAPSTGYDDRHEALLALVPLAKKAKFEDIRDRERRPLRIGIPDELSAAIDKIVKKTGQPRQHVLIELARRAQESKKS